MTKTDICNRALAILGHDRTVEDYETDQSTEALRCRQFYPPALAAVLEAHDWDWAAVETAVAPASAGQVRPYRVPLPDDCARLVRVSDAEGHALRARRNRRELLVYGPTAAVTLRYVSNDVSEDEMPPRFVEALAHQLAYLLCGPMFSDDRKTEGHMRLAQMKLSEAAAIEANETAHPGEWENPFLKARR